MDEQQRLKEEILAAFQSLRRAYAADPGTATVADGEDGLLLEERIEAHDPSLHRTMLFFAERLTESGFPARAERRDDVSPPVVLVSVVCPLSKKTADTLLHSFNPRGAPPMTYAEANRKIEELYGTSELVDPYAGDAMPVFLRTGMTPR